LKKISRSNGLAFIKAFSTEGCTEPLIGLAKDILNIDIAELSFRQPYSICEKMKFINEKGISAFRDVVKYWDISANIIMANKGNLAGDLMVRKSSSNESMYRPGYEFIERFSLYMGPNPIYRINILDFIEFPQDEDATRQFQLWDKERNIRGLPYDYIAAFFEYLKTNFENANQLYWRDYFQDKDLPPEAPEYIRKAADIIEYSNFNEDERAVLDILDKAESDRQ